MAMSYRSQEAVTGVILAAGKGTRMPFSSDCPKPLLPICNEPLIHRQVRQLAAAGAKSIVVVVGHLGEKIKASLGSGKRHGVRITYVLQEKALGIAHALSLVEPHVGQQFCVILGDLFLEFDDLRAMWRSTTENRLAAVLTVRKDRFERVKKNFSVELDSRGLVERVVEKPQEPKSLLKGCGVYLFSREIFTAIRLTPRSKLRDEYELTDAIQTMIDRGARVGVSDVVSRDHNLSSPADLLECNIFAMKLQGVESIVPKSCRVGRSAVVRNSVIGDRAEIEEGCELTNSLVFPNARLGGRLDRAIVTPERTVRLVASDA
jgi:UDP-N-acetylglucosamine diphosphorylase / glucose-1-phosphate thymidylyltransferase / UDP-N-acetylgalactosamine diphosphorylase / glucosamine-1-phosphate N-acetyltransferase / galactosamine-1-phosphate N-acetyltransferase